MPTVPSFCKYMIELKHQNLIFKYIYIYIWIIEEKPPQFAIREKRMIN